MPIKFPVRKSKGLLVRAWAIPTCLGLYASLRLDVVRGGGVSSRNKPGAIPVLWRAMACCGVLWRAVACCGVRNLLESTRIPDLKKKFKISIWIRARFQGDPKCF